ncbi:DNA-binding protein, partial [Escherichia coli]|nr:DNA-binding protein [Escherichia coli]
MNKKLYLFPDSNIFLQCKDLTQVNFSEITACDEVCIIITRPIQQEIDRQKGQGNSRLSKKARKAASLFNQVVDSTDMTLVIRERSPRVFLTMDLSLKPCEQLSEQLDYQEADDRFVGIAAGYCADDPDSEVAIITNDSGPRFSAIKHNIICYKVPSSWLLPAEPDEKDKQIKLLEAKLKQFTQSMPDFSIKVADDEQLNIVLPYYTALSEYEVDNLLCQLTDAFPLVTNFDNEQTTPQSLEKIIKSFSQQEYFPVSADDISLYKEKHYPLWKKQCEEILKNCHTHINPKAIKYPLSFLLQNTGYTIAERAVVTFTAKGDFRLCGFNWEIMEELTESKRIDLPSAPTAPKGKWRSVCGVTERMPYAGGALETPLSSIISKEIGPLLSLTPTERDKNDFYYKEKRNEPVQVVSLECEEWRHQVKEEIFPLFVYTANKPKKVNGAIEVRVDANNLTNPVIKTFKLKITIEEHSAFSTITEMVQTYIQEQKKRQKSSISA